MADSGNKKELLALCSNSLTYDSPSFANLLKSVLTSNSPPFGFQGQNGQHETSQKDNVGVIKPKVTRVQVKLPTEIAMPNLPMMVHKESPRVVSSDHDTPPSHIAKEQPALDGYSWRKYGQKQVKNSRSSRSYYRCANSSCEAKKKVQHCDISGCVLDIVYMGQHNHGIVQNKRIVARVPVVESAQKVDGKDPCSHSEESRHSSVMVGETEQHSSSSSGGKCEGHNGNKPESEKLFKDAEVRQNPESEPGLRKRSKETSAQLNSVSGANKESRTIVHNSADGAITSDGYRWRKYGQKMVKGSSKSRSYYRCTYAGCTAHKHVERALDDSTDTIITYVRIHNHEMPAPKKQKVSCFPADVTMDSVADGHCKSVKSLSSQPIVTKRSMDAEEVLELGGEEALESARTLLAFSALESN